ncbi:5'-3' exoribonuclease 3-like [Rutidosis leptorrhynchoides]|uniref:5'-3' exoribonuclease 3-like n=1 Tax=Rutidosis leptorrhynchoides TaxID=125765 RepID=UPI003A9903DD
MGVPSFYGWLVNKYPKIIVNAIEKTNDQDNGLLSNPNGIEFDNLYLDMNGIIHPCFHPENDNVLEHASFPAVETYGEVFNNIFDYIDRIVNIVRPRKLIYMAIDGVAPRAKMNQQRSRRFRNAKDQETLKKEEEKLRRQFENEGKEVLPEYESQVSDSNVITPGTEFMYELSKQLQSYIRLRIANNPPWKQLKVILSDANSPGEGEHKIMSFIRLQRTCVGYNPNTNHVLYGLDADLIMLALATHEIHFSILRENVSVEDIRQSETKVIKITRFDLDQSLKKTGEQISNLGISTYTKKRSLVKKKPYQFLHVWILREYLNLDLKTINTPEKFELDFERLIDDFIFICFFAGNDFLPHMPTLEIHEGAIDLLLYVYKEEFKNLGGYLVDMQKANDKKGSFIKLKRVEKFILAIGAFEDKIFKKRSSVHDKRLRHILSNLHHSGGNEGEDLFPVTYTCNEKGSATTSSIVDLRGSSTRFPDHDQVLENTKMLKEKLKSYTREASDVWRNGLVTDTVKFGSSGWKRRYYKHKFSADTDEDMEKMRKKVVEKYTEGLCWVLLYYFSHVPSWTWFYPYHYGPFASDMKGLSSTKLVFQKGLPFKPFDQLMAVLPPKSAHALPVLYQLLMTDEESSIHDFFPSDFDIDTDGKRFLWQGISKLPFIDEELLLTATKKIEKDLGEEEVKRNVQDSDQLFLHSSESLASQIVSKINNVGSDKQSSSVKIDISGEINGFVCPKLESVKDSSVLCVHYDPPSFRLHIPRVLEGTSIPETVVNESDIEERQLWHDIHGYQGRNQWSHNRTEGATSNRPGVGTRNMYPDVVIQGAGSGWSGRGRGRVNDATRTIKEQTEGGQSRWNTRGRGHQQRSGMINDPARTNKNQFWTVKTDLGSGQKKELNRWGDSQSKTCSGDNSDRRW